MLSPHAFQLFVSFFVVCVLFGLACCFMFAARALFAIGMWCVKSVALCLVFGVCVRVVLLSFLCLHVLLLVCAV